MSANLAGEAVTITRSCSAAEAWLLGPAPLPPIGSKSHAAHSVQTTIDNLGLTLQRLEHEPSHVRAVANSGGDD